MKLRVLSRSPAYTIDWGILVVGTSFVYDSKLELMFTCDEFDPELELLSEEVSKKISRTEGGDLSFEFLHPPKYVPQINLNTIPFNLSHPYNYFHFLIEALPSLLFLINSNLIRKDDVIISGVLQKNMRSALSYILKGQYQLIELNDMSAVSSTQVIVTENSFASNELISGEMSNKVKINQSRLHELRLFFSRQHQLKFSSINSINQLKIFISRKSLQRNIINEEEVIYQAREYGYLVVTPESLSFEQQVELFSNASIIVGPTGAWLSNLLFVNEKAVVKVLYPETCRTEISMWKKLGNALRVKVSDYYFGVPVLNTYQPIHSDFIVEINVLKNILRDS